jgi:hypothetical protein
MRSVVALFLLILGCFSQSMAFQSTGGAAGAKPARACALLTRELVTQVTPYEKQVLDLVLNIRNRPVETVLTHTDRKL